MPGSVHDVSHSPQLKELLQRTYTSAVLRSEGAASLFAPDMTGIEDPVIVSANSGVGPKLRLANLLGKHEAVGRDCAALCINDILCTGANPLFFSAYAASSKHDDTRMEQIITGISAVCQKAGCAFLGSSRMEKDGVYADDKYDLAGFAVGICDRKKLIDGSKIHEGDILLGLASSGLHNEGFSIVKDIFEPTTRALSRHMPELSCTLGDELLKPSAMYARPILYLTQTLGLNIKGMAHITSGGIIENIPQILPEGIRACITPGNIPVPTIFDLISQKGNIPLDRMFRTFNMGTGLVIVVEKTDVGLVYNALIEAGERPYMAGYCVRGERGVDLVWQRD